ncbi:MAG: GPR endopeptidase [Bacilli bacterium]
MGHEIDLKNYEIRTDLVLDTIENNNSKIKTDINDYDGIKVTKVNLDDENSKLLNKKPGNYVTIEFDDITDSDNKNRIEDIFTEELKNIIDNCKLQNDAIILVVGLGNDKSTPDSLGPKVISNILVTRHLFLLNEEVSSGIRSVAALSPGVMADTGIETVDIVSSVVKEIKPNLVLVIDALAASSIGRVNKSIQITDTGIHPGSGVGNMRKEISFDTLKVPVIAIGVPTVVESSIIVYDTINYLFKHISYIKSNQSKNKLIFSRSNYLDKIKDKDLSKKEKREMAGILGELSENDKRSLINEVLSSLNYNFIVTPKEIDFLIDKLSLAIAGGINNSLHKEV